MGGRSAVRGVHGRTGFVGGRIDTRIDDVPVCTAASPTAAIVLPRECSLQRFFLTAEGVRIAEEMTATPGRFDATAERWSRFREAMVDMKHEAEFSG